MKRTLAMILAIVMVLTILPMVVFADSAPADTVFLTIDGVVYQAHQGEVIDYVYYLCTGEKLCSLMGELTYDVSGLEFVPYEPEAPADPEEEEDETETSSWKLSFPKISTAVVAHEYIPGTVSFNYSNAQGTSFSSDSSKLIDAQFRVTASRGSYELNTVITDVCGADEKKYIYKGVAYNEVPRMESVLLNKEPYDPNATEPATEPVTEPATEPATEAPTQAPTQAPTEAPTQAPTQAPTEAPTQAPTEPANGIGSDGYYREDGVIKEGKGLIEIDGDYYFVIYNGKLKKNGDRTVTAETSNGLLPPGTYHFGEDGKMTNPPVIPQEPENGIGSDDYYRENGVIVANAGLVEIDGFYYFVTYNGKIKKNGDRTVTAEAAHGLVPAGEYNFGPDGKMTNPPPDQPLNGIGTDGYYRENGEVKAGIGLVKVDGAYYYVIYNGQIKKDGDRTVDADHNTTHVPNGTYHFGPDGKMTDVPYIPPYIDEDGYYYENDEKFGDIKGLVLIDGDYYYVTYNGKIKKNGDRTVTEEYANGLLPAGTYNFGEDGKMTNVPVLEGIGADGYYRENGVIMTNAGLICIDGDYYYVIYNGKIKKNGDRTVTAEYANGLLPPGTYHFGADGKMTNVPEIIEEPLDGIDSEGYYRENGEIVPDKGLVKVGDDYYYVVYNGKIKKNGLRTVTAEKSNGLLPPGDYYFDADGKLVFDN